MDTLDKIEHGVNVRQGRIRSFLSRLDNFWRAK